MASFNYPFSIQKDTKAIAAEVQGNFDSLRTWILANLLAIDDTPKMTSQLTLPGQPTVGQHAVTKTYADALVPVGVMMDYGGDNAPTGWLLCDGQTYSTTGQYADLFAVIGYKYDTSLSPGGTFRVPDRRYRVSVGAGPLNGSGTNRTVGSKIGTTTVAQHQHTTPNHSHTLVHTHTIDHNHESVSTGNDTAHTHDINHDHPSATLSSDPTYDLVVQRSYNGSAQAVAVSGTSLSALNLDPSTFSVDIPPLGATSSGTGTAHTHTVDLPNFTGTSGPASSTTTSTANPTTDMTGETADPNFPPAVVNNVIIKAVA